MYTLVPFRRNLSRELPTPFANDNFFRSFFDMSDMLGPAGFRVDVREDDKAYQLEAELPGVPKDKLNVCVDDGTLTISADLNEEKKEEKANYLYSERRSGHVRGRQGRRHYRLADQRGLSQLQLPAATFSGKSGRIHGAG